MSQLAIQNKMCDATVSLIYIDLDHGRSPCNKYILFLKVTERVVK